MSQFSSVTSVLLLSLAATAAADEITDRISTHHGLSAWWATEVLAADVVVRFGGQTSVDGTLYVETNGPRARLDLASGPVVIHDGEEGWIRPPGSEVPGARFHVLTWAWFAIAPWKVTGDGTDLTPWEEVTTGDDTFVVSRQSFAPGEGDTPDDWYDLWVDPATGELTAMGYIVTYGKDLEAANAEPHAIVYHDETTVDGVTIATRWTFHHYDRATGIGDEIGSGALASIRFVDAGDRFAIDESAMSELPMP